MLFFFVKCIRFENGILKKQEFLCIIYKDNNAYQRKRWELKNEYRHIRGFTNGL